MKAVVIRRAGGPEVLALETLPIPLPKRGEVLIRVKAFGLNRSEMFTRQGLSPNVTFPRVLGIEATGIVEDAPPSPSIEAPVFGRRRQGARAHRHDHARGLTALRE